jgi:hypothetical protein
MQSHSASNPHAARSASIPPKSRPDAAERNPGTFSTKTHVGLTRRTTRMNSGQSQRSSASPSLRPATLTGWQGNPPQRRSTGASSSPVSVVMSPYLGTSGQCFVKTRRHHSSISTCQRTSIPARSSPRSIPPIPENREPTVSVIAGPRGRHGVLLQWKQAHH